MKHANANGKVIAMINHKGGCGKTTTAKNLAYELSELGNKVLLIDLDPQCNSTKGLSEEEYKNNAMFIFCGDNILDYTYETRFGFEIIAGSSMLSSVDVNQDILGRQLNTLKERFEYILIDNSPFFNQVTASVILNSDLIVIPSILENDSLDGVLTSVKEIKTLVPSIQYKILVTRVDKMKSTESDLNIIYDVFKPNICKTYIRHHNYAVKRSRAHSEPIGKRYEKSTTAEDYRNLAIELSGGQNNG